MYLAALWNKNLAIILAAAGISSIDCVQEEKEGFVNCFCCYNRDQSFTIDEKLTDITKHNK